MKTGIVILKLFLLTFNAKAEIVFSKVSIDSTSYIEAEAKSCRELENFAKKIASWKFPQSDLCQPKYNQTSQNCKANLSGCFPPQIVKSFNVKLAGDWKDIDGPNCFGTAVFSAGLSPSITHLNTRSILGLLSAPLCQELSDASKAEAGDIGFLYRDGTLLHAYTYLSEDYVWHKENPDASSYPKIETVKKMNDVFSNVGGECRACLHKKDAALDPNCTFCLEPVKTKFMRCLKAEEVYKKMRESLTKSDEMLKMQLQVVDQIVCRASDSMFKSGALSKSAADDIFNLMKPVAQYYHDEVTKNPIKLPPQSERDWLLASIALKMSSVQVQNENSYQILEIQTPFKLPNEISQLLNLD